jgi:DNA-binding GntR family transcriptional regulator
MQLTLTPLQQKTVRDIILHIRQARFDAGQHLTASSLASQLGVSRSPVNAALAYLAETGVVAHDRNRGFFLLQPADSLGDTIASLVSESEDPLYQRIVDLRLAKQLPAQVLESELMRILDTTRANVGRVLSRIQEEGWIEKRAGQGWEFLSLIDSKEAYDESYIYRLALEPAALLSPQFKANKQELDECLRQQVFIAESGYLSMTPYELFEANCRFHESIARWSNNRFIHQSLTRLDKLRRLVEYRQAKQRTPRREQALEHIEILKSIARGDQVEAASLIRQHLNQARQIKTTSPVMSDSMV